MNNEEFRELKRELLKEMDDLRREYASFKRRISIIANMLIPGIGFILYDGSYLKGIATFVLFNLWLSHKKLENINKYSKIWYNNGIKS